MPVETPSLFAEVIKDHLALKEQNSTLDRHMPIDRYKNEDPFQNHPLFKTEEQARLEETMDGAESAATAAVVAAVEPEEALQAWTEPVLEAPAPAEQEEDPDGLWGRSRDFDWGD
jgi:hypothetical protein